MKLAAVCCTYKRPDALATAIECFLRQDYPASLRELVILDDAGQYDEQVGDGWRIVSTSSRFPTLGEKRNACAALVSADAQAFCVWDDDDIYLPWHMRVAAEALAEADYAVPSEVLILNGSEMSHKKNQNRLYHPSWSYRREALEQVGGYPSIQSGEDQGLRRRFEQAELTYTDPLLIDPRPSLLYRWFSTHSSHLSALGVDGYENLAADPFEPVKEIKPAWERDWVDFAESVTS